MENSLLQLIKSLSNMASLTADNKLRHLDISLTQYFVFDVVVNNEGISILKAAKQIGCDRSTLSRALSVLIRDGYIARKIKAGADARKVTLHITKKGNMVHESAKTILDKLSSDVINSVSSNISLGRQEMLDYFSVFYKSLYFENMKHKHKKIF